MILESGEHVAAQRQVKCTSPYVCKFTVSQEVGPLLRLGTRLLRLRVYPQDPRITFPLERDPIRPAAHLDVRAAILLVGKDHDVFLLNQLGDGEQVLAQLLHNHGIFKHRVPTFATRKIDGNGGQICSLLDPALAPVSVNHHRVGQLFNIVEANLGYVIGTERVRCGS